MLLQRDIGPKNALEGTGQKLQAAVLAMIPGCEGKAQAKMAMANTGNSLARMSRSVSGAFTNATREVGNAFNGLRQGAGLGPAATR